MSGLASKLEDSLTKLKKEISEAYDNLLQNDAENFIKNMMTTIDPVMKDFSLFINAMKGLGHSDISTKMITRLNGDDIEKSIRDFKSTTADLKQNALNGQREKFIENLSKLTSLPVEVLKKNNDLIEKMMKNIISNEAAMSISIAQNIEKQEKAFQDKLLELQLDAESLMLDIAAVASGKKMRNDTRQRNDAMRKDMMAKRALKQLGVENPTKDQLEQYKSQQDALNQSDTRQRNDAMRKDMMAKRALKQLGVENPTKDQLEQYKSQQDALNQSDFRKAELEKWYGIMRDYMMPRRYALIDEELKNFRDTYNAEPTEKQKKEIRRRVDVQLNVEKLSSMMTGSVKVEGNELTRIGGMKGAAFIERDGPTQKEILRATRNIDKSLKDTMKYIEATAANTYIGD